MDLEILLLLSLDKDIHGKPKKLNSKQLDTIRKLGYVKVLTKLWVVGFCVHFSWIFFF